MPKISFDIKKFADTIMEHCDKAQVKQFDRNEIITTYIVNRNMLFIVLEGSADLIRYDFNGNQTIVGCNILVKSENQLFDVKRLCFPLVHSAMSRLFGFAWENSLPIKDNYHNEIFDWAGEDKLILLTAHRRENLGEPMRNIFKAVRRIVGEYPDVKVVYPIHLNPKVREVANEVFDGIDRVKLIEPLEVIDFHNFQNKSYIILTDSGGIQEEAPSLGKPVLVLRDTTERPEGIQAGTLKLVGTDEETVYKETKKLLDNKNEYEKMSMASNPYGDGFASKYIVDVILEKYK